MMCRSSVMEILSAFKIYKIVTLFKIVSDLNLTNPYWSNVEVHSTALTAVPGPMTRSNRRVMLPSFVGFS